MKSPLLRLRCFILAVVTLALIFPAGAQNNTASLKAVADFSGRLAKPDQLEGTIETEVNGMTARAAMQFQAPDRLRIEIEASDNAPAQIIVSSGNETRLYDPINKRVQRLPYNLLTQWWRGASLASGGPAGFVFTLLAPTSTTPFYAGSTPAPGELLLAAQDDPGRSETRKLVSDSVRFGGGGDRIFYAPFKRYVWNRPSKIVLKHDAANAQITRKETDDNEQNFSSTMSLSAGGLPKSAVITDSKNRVASSWKYNLEVRAEAFPAKTFSFNFAPDLLVEDAQLKSIREYSEGAAEASNQLNLGTALARQAEDWPAAFAAWDEASRLEPKATAPHFTIYDAALLTRDLDRAEAAVANLSPLLGRGSFEIAMLQVGVLTTRRDWKAAQAVLEMAMRQRPQNLSARLSLADLLRASGDADGASAQLMAILQSESVANATKARAAEMLATLAFGKSADGVLRALPEATLWQQLARAHIELQNGRMSILETDDLGALESYAIALERAGHQAQAIAAWQNILERVAFPSDQNARLHLMALYAQKGDTTLSLAQYRELITASPSLQTKSEFQDALLSAWQKSVRREQLKTVLEQRATAANADEDNARLWLKFQETFGSNDDVGAAISNGLGRYDRSAWWRGRQAEFLAAQIAQTENLTPAALGRLQREAQSIADDAVALDPEQPYYAIQSALILTQRASPVTALYDSRARAASRKTAMTALNALLEKWPADPDVQIAVASQRLALENEGAHRDTIAMLQFALREGAPSTIVDRHFVSFSSRQVLASALRRDGRDDELAAQYLILFQASRAADEQLGVALNYFRWQMNQGRLNAVGAALVAFAREPWPFDDSQQLMQPLVNIVNSIPSAVGKASPATQVLAFLKASRDPYALLVVAYLKSNNARTARLQAVQPNAAPDAAQQAEQAAEEARNALQALTVLADGEDKILASRVAALLGEEAMNKKALEEAEQWLQRAVALEPRDVNLRVALATALLARGKTDAALSVRDQAMQALPHSFEVLQRLAGLSYRIAQPADKATTLQLALAAMNLGRSLPAIPAGDWLVAAFTAARAQLDAGNDAQATAIYNQLSDPQWDLLSRAVTLIDWETNLRHTGRDEQAAGIAARLKELKLTARQRRAARNIWSSLN